MDVFNAAQSGAMAPNLVTHEFSYLLDQLKHVHTYEQLYTCCYVAYYISRAHKNGRLE